MCSKIQQQPYHVAVEETSLEATLDKVTGLRPPPQPPNLQKNLSPLFPPYHNFVRPAFHNAKRDFVKELLLFYFIFRKACN